jgi:hypothetical protein
MGVPLIHFLIVFDHDEATLLRTERFEDSDLALEAYAAEERRVEEEHEGRRIEVVLIGSDSLDTIKRTHANYFDGTVAVSEYLAGL